MTGIMCTLVGNGANSIYVGSATVTVGFLSIGGFSSYGFDLSTQGSITPAVWGGSNLAFRTLKYVTAGWVDFTVSGIAPNSGWTTLTIGSTTFDRADASYSSGSGTTSWIFTEASNPFGTTIGATRAIIWA